MREEPLWVLVGEASRAVKREVGTTAWAVLEDLALEACRDGNGALARTTVRIMADHLGLTSGTVARAVARLCAAGLVRREDRRVPGTEGTVAHRQEHLDRLRGETAQSRDWNLHHGWRRERLRVIEQELAEQHGYIPLLDLTPDNQGLLTRDHARHSGLDPRARLRGDETPAWWADRLPEVAMPPLPGRDTGVGIDLGP